MQTILGNGFRAIVTLCREEKTARRKRPKAASADERMSGYPVNGTRPRTMSFGAACCSAAVAARVVVAGFCGRTTTAATDAGA